MPAPLIIPDHLKQARLSLLVAGVPVDEDSPAFAALMCAAVAYNRTPQLNHAAHLRQQLAEAERENRRLTAELLREGGRADQLRARLGHPPPARSGGLALTQQDTPPPHHDSCPNKWQPPASSCA